MKRGVNIAISLTGGTVCQTKRKESSSVMYIYGISIRAGNVAHGTVIKNELDLKSSDLHLFFVQDVFFSSFLCNREKRLVQLISE